MGTLEYRAYECSQFSKQSYNGELFEWTPSTDEENPCALVCKSTPQGHTAIVAAQVIDGTLCGPHSKGVCIQGTCKVWTTFSLHLIRVVETTYIVLRNSQLCISGKPPRYRLFFLLFVIEYFAEGKVTALLCTQVFAT